MGRSKIVYGGQVLIDLTADTVKPEQLLEGVTAHGADGEKITGTCTFDADTSDATATAAEILANKTAYNKGNKITGTMKNNGAVAGKISKVDEVFTIPLGFHDGSGTVGLDETEKAKLIPENIRAGVSVFNVFGAMSTTEGAKPQAKTVTPKTAQQVVLPDTGYNYLSQVTVAAIPYEESENSAGGITVTIA